MIIFRAFHSEVQKCNFLKITSSALSTISFKWQKMSIQRKCRHFRLFSVNSGASSLLLCPGLLLFCIPGGWLRGLVEEVARQASHLHMKASTLVPTATSQPTSSPHWHLYRPVAEAASAGGVASCWPRGVNWLLNLY